VIESPDVEHVTTQVKPLRVGLMGCGTVSVPYLTNLMGSAEIDVVSCTDLLPERARARADQFGVSRVYSQDELFSAPDIELVVNLTVPDSHFDVSMGVLRSGKHVWTEKPLGVDREQGRALIHEAGERGLQIGCAPDTVLGAGLQTSRKLVDEGLIGEPLAAAAFMLSRGPESWHPDPVFLYQPGAGPLFDIGVYYVSALVNLLGPVSRVSAFSRLLFPERVIASGPRAGEAFSVGTDTFIAGILEFESGVLANLVSAYGVWGAGLPKIQVYGSEGVLNVPDPNGFGGPVRANLHTDELGWRELPLAYNHTDHCGNCRGLGVIEMAQALFEGRAPRASAALAYHVLDVMQSMAESAAGGGHVKVASTCARPSPLPAAAPVAEGAK
jgi:predicted dehydrogenase